MTTRSRTAVFAIVVWGLLSACLLFRPNDPEEESPPEYEGCSDDHTAFLRTVEGVEIVVDSGVADRDCNEIRYHSGGGGQGGEVFHIEPRLRVLGEGARLMLENLTWEVSDMDGNMLLSQGFEVFDGDLDPVDGGVEFRGQLFIGAGERGKNLRLRALSSLPSESGASTDVDVEAAVYVSGPE